MIEICNLRTTSIEFPYDVRIDRQSPLGNPFRMRNESERDLVCDKYTIYFNENLKDNECLLRLINLYKQYGRLRLFCWCAPRRCHGETIRDYILERITHDQA